MSEIKCDEEIGTLRLLTELLRVPDQRISAICTGILEKVILSPNQDVKGH
jgi:hypothetical protein